MDIVLEYVQIWKSQCTFLLVSVSHVTMTSWVKIFCSQNLLNLISIAKIILCWSIFGIEPSFGFCLFVGYWPSKNVSRDHDIEDEFVSLAWPIVLRTFRNRILCWSILKLEPIAHFCSFLGYWTSKNSHLTIMLRGICFSCETCSIWYCWEYNFI